MLDQKKQKRPWHFYLASIIMVFFSCLCLGIHCDDDDDDDDHYVNVPDRPSGNSTANVGESVTFESGGSSCEEGDAIEYRFDFGDDTYSSWRSHASASHEYDYEGTFHVRAQARCSWYTSYWSYSHTIDISNNVKKKITVRSLCEIDGKVWAAGDEGRIFTYQDGQKKAMKRFTRNAIYAIWGNTSQRIFCCGSSGNLYSYNGQKWTQCSFNIFHDLYAISGTADDVFVAGSKGVVLHDTSEGWHIELTPFQESLYGIWAENSGSVFAVGNHGVILHYNGAEWKEMRSPSSETLRSVWGTAYTNVWAVGDKGTILHFDGNAWKEVPCPIKKSFKCVRGLDVYRVYILADDAVLCASSNDIRNMPYPQNGAILESLGISSGQKFVYIAGSQETIVEVPIE